MIYVNLYGRIGNNLFQIAAAASLAHKNNTYFVAFPKQSWCPEPDNCFLKDYLKQFNENILRRVTLVDEIPANLIEYKEVSYSFTPIPFYGDMILNGYFQSEKYFDSYVIRELFKIDFVTYGYIIREYGHLLSTMDITSINVRRGDYLKVPHYHPVCSFKYYLKAIDYIGNQRKFLITSDDIDWCKKKFKGPNFYFIEDKNPTVDLYLQSLCTNNIISNSSFSWWGAWLNNNPDKIVITPSENWFGKYHGIKDLSDLIPQNWIKIDNPMEFSIKLRIFHYDLIQFGLKIKKRILRPLRKRK